ncbi:hypothetical protein [Sphaerisporangium sp. TRM90804]|uniref:hypothetical protein n=1 Tax=Sphaerisporangium sp. TRM90804 TaxID=3031113 RepID=UPI002446A7DA|nr:hypothetical protein [Sphaerisporangium sp. TRM90804]MDH2424802.1 hypothetical protein [Sphaerisporangium sp. TRM90804]
MISPFGHQHRWTPIRVTRPKRAFTVAEGHTLVLRRCRCGDYDTVALTGIWPADAFRPAAGQVGLQDILMFVLIGISITDNLLRDRPVVAALWAAVGAVGAFMLTWRARRKSNPPAEEATSQETSGERVEQGSEVTR